MFVNNMANVAGRDPLIRSGWNEKFRAERLIGANHLWHVMSLMNSADEVPPRRRLHQQIFNLATTQHECDDSTGSTCVSFTLRTTAESLCSSSQRSVSTSWTLSTRPTPCSTWCGGIRPARRFLPWWRPSVTHWWFSIASWCQKSGTETRAWWELPEKRTHWIFFKCGFIIISNKKKWSEWRKTADLLSTSQRVRT